MSRFDTSDELMFFTPVVVLIGISIDDLKNLQFNTLIKNEHQSLFQMSGFELSTPHNIIGA